MREFTKSEQELMIEMGNVWETSMRELSQTPGDWVYRSMWTNVDAFNDMVNIINEDNIHFVSGQEHKDGAFRFSIFISPKGIQNLTEWRDKQVADNP